MAKLAKTDPAQSAYVADSALAVHFGVSRATIWRWANETTFPAPVKLSAQITRWRWADVADWESAQATAA